MKTTNIVICGGHPSPAIAVIEALQSKKMYAISYVSPKKALAKDDHYSWEYNQITKLGIPFHHLTTGKLQRNISIESVYSFIKIPLGLYQAFILLQKLKPRVVVSFGGYIAFPLIIAAKILHIPVLTHEQTTQVGLSNKIISRMVNTFCISYEEVTDQIKNEHIILTGNPIRKDILHTTQSKFSSLIGENKPLVYITGGGLGSHFINNCIAQCITQLLLKFTVIHQVGDSAEYRDYDTLVSIRQNLPADLQMRYIVEKHIEAKDIGWILRNALFLIGRSGANTTSEILYTHIPAVLVPLPHSGEGEQQTNAAMLKSLGVAIVLDQQKMTPQDLLTALTTMRREYQSYKDNFGKKTDSLVHPNAAVQIASAIEHLVIQ